MPLSPDGNAARSKYQNQVDKAVNTLKKQGLVSHEPYGDIILTEKGFELGEAVYHRHTMIKKFLVNVLHIPEDDAEKEACQVELNISQNTVEKMKKSFVKTKRSTETVLLSDMNRCPPEFINLFRALTPFAIIVHCVCNG